MLKSKLFYAAMLFSIAAYSQQPAVVDTFKAKIDRAVTIDEKFELTGQLSRLLMNTNPIEADQYGNQLIAMAETTRDRKLMINAQLINGERYANLAGRKENVDKAITYYTTALEMSRFNKLDELTIKAYLSLSGIYRNIPDVTKALSYCNEAYAFVGIVHNDSITARVHLSYGFAYMASNEKLLALRNLLSALRIAEELKNHSLMRSCYSSLASFYADIEDYDKAIDYQVKTQQTLDYIQSGQTPYNKVIDLNNIGDLFAAKKNYEMANFYYEKALALADSLQYEPIKANSYKSILNSYLAADQPQKALDYFNQHPQLAEFLQTIGFGHFTDQSYGIIHTRIGNYDSAKYYFNKIAPFFEKDVNVSNQYGFNYFQGILYKKTGELDKSFQYFKKAQLLAEQTGNLQLLSSTSEMLDSVSLAKGDYKAAVYYAGLHYKYKDSLAVLGKEKELMQVEATDEQQRLDRNLAEAAESKRQRNNIQYIAITLGIVALFVLLVILGMFKVSATTIQMVGFFAFLMFFEFIFLIFKKNIYSITKGEPWKDLLFMILLAAILLPLHHWMEHAVIKYLTSHNRLTKAGYHFKTKFLRRSKKT